jgi:hypothetical protein
MQRLDEEDWRKKMLLVGKSEVSGAVGVPLARKAVLEDRAARED